MAANIVTQPLAEAVLASVAHDDRTTGGLFLPHFDNKGRLDIDRLRATIILLDGLVSGALDAADVQAIVSAAIAGVVDSSPATLDTLNELAAALGDDPNFAATIAAQIGQKASSGDLAAEVSARAALGTAVGNRLDTVEGNGWVTFSRLAGALVATAAEIRSATANKLVTPANENAANAIYDVPFASTITLDGNNGRVQRITATANFTLALGQNFKNGRYELEVVSSGAVRTMSFASGWRFAKGKLATLTQIAGAVDVFLIRPNGANPAIVPTAFLDLKAPV